jgi:hypothetical protein
MHCNFFFPEVEHHTCGHWAAESALQESPSTPFPVREQGQVPANLHRPAHWTAEPESHPIELSPLLTSMLPFFRLIGYVLEPQMTDVSYTQGASPAQAGRLLSREVGRQPI